MPKTTERKSKTISQNEASEHPLSKDVDFIPCSTKIPCDLGEDAFLPYWERKDGELIFGIDKYTVCSVTGSGDIWLCKLRDDNGKQSKVLEANVDVFFSKKDAERKVNALKKMEDQKKMLKWKRRDIEDVGI